jgi:hypothetical protein
MVFTWKTPVLSGCKRLEQLRLEKVKLILKALTKRKFTLRSKILYLHEAGKYRLHELEPVTIEVKELGISGWLKRPITSP